MNAVAVHPYELATPVEEDVARRRQREVAAMTIVVLNVLDVLLTQYILRTHPASREGNGLVAQVIMSPWIWLPKVGIPFAVLLSTARAPLTRVNYWGMGVVWAVYWGVVAWNVHILFV